MIRFPPLEQDALAAGQPRPAKFSPSRQSGGSKFLGPVKILVIKNLKLNVWKISCPFDFCQSFISRSPFDEWKKVFKRAINSAPKISNQTSILMTSFGVRRDRCYRKVLIEKTGALSLSHTLLLTHAHTLAHPLLLTHAHTHGTMDTWLWFAAHAGTPLKPGAITFKLLVW